MRSSAALAHEAQTGLVLAALSLFPSGATAAVGDTGTVEATTPVAAATVPDPVETGPISYKKDMRLPDEQIALLREFLGVRGGIISIELVPEGKEPPRPRAPFFAPMPGSVPVIYDLSLDKFEENGFASLSVNGRIGQIIFQAVTTNPASNPEGSGTVREFYDEFGNFVTEDTRYGNVVDVRVRPRINFVRDPSFGEEAPQAISVGLSAFGLGAFCGPIAARCEAPFMFSGNGEAFGVYSNLDHAASQNLFAPFASVTAGAIAEAEALFGFDAGDKIRNIYIVNDYNPNGMFTVEYADTILITDEELRILTLDADVADFHVNTRVPALARHETFHALDNLLRLSVEEFTDWYNELTKSEALTAFCEELDERNFLKLGGAYGHSADNPRELLATFMNSFAHLSSDEWNKHVLGHSESFRINYRNGLDALEKRLLAAVARGEISDHAPVLKRVEEMKEVVN